MVCIHECFSKCRYSCYNEETSVSFKALFNREKYAKGICIRYILNHRIDGCFELRYGFHNSEKMKGTHRLPLKQVAPALASCCLSFSFYLHGLYCAISKQQMLIPM